MKQSKHNAHTTTKLITVKSVENDDRTLFITDSEDSTYSMPYLNMDEMFMPFVPAGTILTVSYESRFGINFLKRIQFPDGSIIY